MICVLILLTACTSKSNKGNDILPTNQDPADHALISNPALSRSGALIVASPDITSTFNPLFVKSKVDGWLKDLVFDGLFVFNASGELEGTLAESWTSSENNLVYTVLLKKSVKFHDGTVLTAKDVVFTYNTIMNEAYMGAYKKNATYLSSVEAVDDFTLTFTFKTERLDNLRVLVMPILSEKHYHFTNWNTFVEGFRTPLGTGAFKFESYSQHESIVLLKNPDYWKTNAKISGVIFRQMDEETALQAFNDGKIDLLEIETSKAIVNDIKALGFGNVMTKNTDLVTFIGLDSKVPIFSEANVRKALLIGLDREQFILDQWSGFASTVSYLATDPHEYTYENENLEMYTYDFDKASQLLDEIGWRDYDGDGYREKNGDRLAFTWYVFTDVEWSYNLAIQASKQWEKLGFRVALIFGDYETMMAQLESEAIPTMWNLAWEMSRDINPERLFGQVGDVGIYNYAKYENGVAQAIFDDLHVAKSDREREALLRTWHIVQNETLPYLPIAKLKTIWAYNSRLRNLSLDENTNWTDHITLLEIDVLQ
jgi:peptide/nickel transport system substrate-binding protein